MNRLFKTLRLFISISSATLNRGVWGLLFFMFAFNAGAKINRPKLVVGVVVDQMRWDYFYYYYDKATANGGLRRLVDQGFSCENCMINYVPSVTAAGHASVYTGSVPALHGIVGNNFIVDGQWTSSVKDTQVKSVGSSTTTGQASPHLLQATTLGDQIRLATDFRGRVYGVALKDRAAILPAGHAANAAYWFDSKVGHFITSDYYMKELPRWVKGFNERNAWKPGEDPKMSPDGVTLTFRMAQAIVDNERIGTDDDTDLLAISISSTDAIGHEYGTRGEENWAVYQRLDKELGQFIDYLDRQIGRDNYLLFLTADHGAAHNPNYMKQNHIPSAGWDGKALFKAIDKALVKKFGVANLIAGENINFAFLDYEKLDSAKIDAKAVKDEVVRVARQCPDLMFVCAREDAASANIPQAVRERIINGSHPKRQGDIVYIPRPQMFSWTIADDYRGTTHGQWNPYDTHLPLFFFGWHQQQGQTNTPVIIGDIAATVCAMLHIQAPSACIGQPIMPVLEAHGK